MLKEAKWSGAMQLYPHLHLLSHAAHEAVVSIQTTFDQHAGGLRRYSHFCNAFSPHLSKLSDLK